jgi:nucleoside-diphosphate-sugar epimerase
MSRRVLVTHADEPIGRRLIKTLYHDEEIERIVAVGKGPPPRSFDVFLSGPSARLRYARVDLAKHRPVADLFHSAQIREAELDAVIHVPRHGPSSSPGEDERPLLAGLADRTAEARLVLQHSLESASVKRLVAIGSAFVYRLAPGNANRLTEDSELDLDPRVPAELRSWIDCDMIFHGEVHNSGLEVTLLRVPAVVTSGGYVFLHPSLVSAGRARFRPLGFDPLCTVVSDKDVARATRLALHSRRTGIFNVAGREALPLSVLARWTGAPSLPLPGALLRAVSRGVELLGREGLRASLDGPHLRYGFTLDTSRAERLLGFRPGYRVGLERAGDGRMRLETAPV